MRTKSASSSGPRAADKSTRNDVKVFVAGAVAGTVSKTLTAPLARLTILRQVTAADKNANKTASMLAEMRAMVASGGVRQLFRGNAAAVCHRIPFSGVYHGTYNMLRAQQGASESLLIRLFNGSVAGASACVVAYPLDLARSLIASGRGRSTSIVGVLTDEVKTAGIRSVYRGLGPTLVTVTPNLGVNYCIYDTVHAAKIVADPTGATLLSAASAGVASSLITHPLDLVRRICQVDGAAGSQSRYNGSLFRTFRGVYANNPFAMWRGLTPELAKVVPSVCLTFSVFELLKAAL